MTEPPTKALEVAEFTANKDDFLQAQWLHHTNSLRGRRFIVTIAAAAIGFGLLLASMSRDPTVNPIEYFVVSEAFFLGVIAVMIVINRFIMLPRAATRQFSQLKEFRGQIVISVEPPHIGIASKNGLMKIPTGDFLKWAENDKTFLLYRSDRLFHFIPKRVFSDTFYRSLVAELTRAGVPMRKFSNS